MNIFRWVSVTFLLFMLTLIILALPLKNARIVQTDLETSLLDDQSGYLVEGTLSIENPSRLTIPVQSITYTMTLEDTGKQIGSTTLGPFILKRNAVSEVPLRQEMHTNMSAEELLQYSSQDHVWVQLEGSALLDWPLIGRIPIPFYRRFDTKHALVQSEVRT